MCEGEEKAMAQQEEGWPLGLQPLNVRVGLVRNGDLNGSVSFSTLLTGSRTSSTDSSSDLDTQSTGSFFPDKSITLGSLIGFTSILELSRRSTRARAVVEPPFKDKKSCKSRPWLFSLCSKLSTDAVSIKNNTPSLGNFLEAERRAASICGRNQSPTTCGLDDFSHTLPDLEPNSLFVGGHVAPPRPNDSWLGSSVERRANRDLLEHGDGHGAPLLFSCLCGQLTH